MPFYHILLLALVQGLTEFLPVSSSGHLLLTHSLLGNEAHDLCWAENRLMDVAVHIGTLIAVLFYFKKDLCTMLCGITNPKSGGFKMALNVLIASIPVIIAGFILEKFQPSILCLVQIMAWTTLIFGIVLWIADKYKTTQKIEDMKVSQAVIIGLSQTIALIPGVSRSGITMTSARFLGFDRIEAARFSLLLSIVAISGAGALNGFEVYQSGNLILGKEILIGIALSAISGFIAIALMMKWLTHATFKPFAIYRIVLGIVLLALIYGGLL